MTEWQFIKAEYERARLRFGWRKALQLALEANKQPLQF